MSATCVTGEVDGEVDEAETLELERPWDPFSEESLWCACPGHAWERMEWPCLGWITRCAICGADRCAEFSRPEDITPQLWLLMGDHEQQLYRCTEERGHEDEHDFLAGEKTE